MSRTGAEQTATGRGLAELCAKDPAGWDHYAFVHAVERITGVDRADARRVIRATLWTLGEMLTPEEARTLGSLLPAEIAPFVGSGPKLQRMETLSTAEFLQRVSVRSDLDADQDQEATAVLVEAVLGVMRTATGLAVPVGPFARSDHAGPVAGRCADDVRRASEETERTQVGGDR